MRGREKQPGTYCWCMRLVPKFSGNLDTPRILSVTVIPRLRPTRPRKSAVSDSSPSGPDSPLVQLAAVVAEIPCIG